MGTVTNAVYEKINGMYKFTDFRDYIEAHNEVVADFKEAYNEVIAEEALNGIKKQMDQKFVDHQDTKITEFLNSPEENGVVTAWAKELGNKGVTITQRAPKAFEIDFGVECQEEGVIK